MKVAASPQSINRAMPEGGIQVTSHQSLVTPNPQSPIPNPWLLIPSRWSLSASHPCLLIAAFTCLPLFIPYYYTTIGEGGLPHSRQKSEIEV